MHKTYLYLAQSFKRLSDGLIASKTWPWNISIYTYVAILFISFPSYELFFQPNNIVLKNWRGLNEQCLHPFTPNPFSADEHEGQIAFRLLLPVISHFLGTNIYFWFFVQHLAGLLFIGLLASFLKRTFQDNSLTMAAFAAVVFSYLFKGFFVDVIGYFDGMGWLLLLGACLTTRPVLMGTFCFFGAYVDERCAMALPLVVLYHIILRPNSGQRQNSIFTDEYSLKFIAAGAGSLLMIAGVRYYLSTHYGLAIKADQTATVGIEPLFSNYKVAPLILLTGLDFLMPAMFLSTLILWVRNRRLEAGLLLAYLCIATISCLIVFDLSRTTSYLFPGVMLFFALLARFETRKVQATVVGFLFVANLLFPPLFSVGEDILWMGPAVPKLLKMIFAGS